MIGSPAASKFPSPAFSMSRFVIRTVAILLVASAASFSPGLRAAEPVGGPLRIYVPRRDQGYALVPLDTVAAELETRRDRIKEIVRRLQGPFEDPQLVPTVPEGVELRAVYQVGDVVILDLSRDLISRHPGGRSAAWTTVASLVNSVLDQGMGQHVRILIEGEDRAALAEVIDLTRPLGRFPDRPQSIPIPEK